LFVVLTTGRGPFKLLGDKIYVYTRSPLGSSYRCQ